jgi:hypothetical protein
MEDTTVFDSFKRARRWFGLFLGICIASYSVFDAFECPT